ncbi:MAG: YraN family protein [Bacteroidetes bacterium]|jgi:putative endonuclease|nr:YraN family protein [Bacteroidota bacterium]MBT5528542.1 YraN family protein [Cytophagia bacterium]MBT3421409.1 YraN family protein [Bacteroidota bacterium]MBT3800037.1 YraN family protein [Bacteroidota bacterium]MBT3935780.1 YraN family protein [Bacteroidota bacterium]
MAEHNELGRKGEELAANYLQAKGYKILHRNWIFEKDELDIVCLFQNTIVFVEVKTRSSDSYGHPEEAVGKAKQEKLLRIIDTYLNQFQLDLEIRIDIVSIILTANEQKIYHIEDAVTPFFEN